MKNQIGITRRDFVTGTLALVAGLGLSACASGGSGSSQSAADDSGSSHGAEGHGGSHKVLVAYFSAQGHTKRVAERIAKDMDGDTFEVVPEQAYSDDDPDYNDDNSRVSKEYQDESLRDIALKATMPDDWSEYDVVFAGYPIWWYDYVWPIRRFASDNNFASKTVIPFCTSISLGVGSSAKNLAAVAGTGDWQDGQRFGENAGDDEVDNWVSGLGL